MSDPHELVGVRIGQRLDHHGIDDAEDRRRRADADREREHGGQCEGRPLPQAPLRMAKIATDGLEEIDDAHAAPSDARSRARRADGHWRGRRHVRLAQRPHEIGERVVVQQLRAHERERFGLVDAAAAQLGVAELEVLGELVDDFLLARGMERSEEKTCELK